MKKRPPGDFTEALLGRARAILPAFDAGNLANFAYGLSVLGIVPPNEWLDDYCDRLYEALPEMGHQHVTDVLTALAA